MIRIQENKNKKNLVFMCFNINTNKQHRTDVYRYFNDKPWVTNLCENKTGKYLEDKQFMEMLTQHYFVISPFGNGIDCGRTWMSLQLGCIPIIPYHDSFVNFEKELPLILYKNINDITEEFLLEKLKIINSTNYNYDLLKISYWDNIINNKT